MSHKSRRNRELFLLLSTLVLGLLPLALQGQSAADPLSDSTVALEGIVVTATPVPVPEGALGSHVSVLSGDELRGHGVTQVADALRAVSGLTVVRSGSFGARSTVFLRGGESDYVLVMIDGVPLNQPGGAVDLAGLTTEDVERIEIVRGPASGLYGSDAVTGVIQIITRRGERGLAGSATVRGGSFGSLDGILDVRGGSESGSFALSMARYDTDGILPFNNRHRNAVLSGRAELRLDPRSTARLTTRLQDRVYRFPTDDAGLAVDINQSSFSEEAMLGVEVDRSVGERLTLRGLVTLNDVDSGTDDAPDGPEDDVGFFGFQSLDRMRRVTADVRANWHVSERTVLTAGGELERQQIRSFSESLSEFGTSTGRSENSRSNGAIYGHALTGLGRVALNGGLRVEDNELYGRFVTYQGGSGVDVRPGTRIRVAAGRGIKEPTFFEAFASGFAVGNPDLQPERSTSWELGIEQDLWRNVRFGATWFDQSFEDLIQFTFSPPSPGDPNFFNVAAAESRGVELDFSAAVGSSELTGSWTWLDTKVRDPGFDEGPSATFVDGEPLIRRPGTQGSLGARGVIAGRLRWRAELQWVDERSDRNFRVFPAEPVTLEGYTLVHLGLDATVVEVDAGRPGLDLILRIDNLGDTDYQEAFGFEAPGRGIYLGGRVHWRDG